MIKDWDAQQTPKPALTFTGIPLAYWRREVALGCAVALARLRRIVESRGCDWEQTIAAIEQHNAVLRRTSSAE
jgi:hypothetical protein